MAVNYSFGKAVEVIAKGEDIEAIQDIGKRFLVLLLMLRLRQPRMKRRRLSRRLRASPQRVVEAVLRRTWRRSPKRLLKRTQTLLRVTKP